MAQLILTRPTAQAFAWAQALQSAGHQVEQLPMIEIAATDSHEDIQALDEALQAIPSLHALMFVSSNAVEHFWRQKWPLVGMKSTSIAINLIVNNSFVRCWATGPGTVQALLAAGMRPAQIDAPQLHAEQFDSEALWQIVRPQINRGQKVLIVRGRDVDSADSSRDWLAQQVQAAGGQVTSLVVYERRAPQLSQTQLAQSQAWLLGDSWWIWSSSQALRHLPLQLDVSRARCICTHERIAQMARARGFATVLSCKPTPQALAASIESFS
jgi:uroporphyrinogen-III synthase